MKTKPTEELTEKVEIVDEQDEEQAIEEEVGKVNYRLLLCANPKVYSWNVLILKLRLVLDGSVEKPMK